MEKLLRLLDAGRALSPRALAEALNVSAETVAAQIEYLERLGLLRRVGDGCACGGGCKGCGSKCHGSAASPLVMWERTGQGPGSG